MISEVWLRTHMIPRRRMSKNDIVLTLFQTNIVLNVVKIDILSNMLRN